MWCVVRRTVSGVVVEDAHPRGGRTRQFVEELKLTAAHVRAKRSERMSGLTSIGFGGHRARLTDRLTDRSSDRVGGREEDRKGEEARADSAYEPTRR